MAKKMSKAKDTEVKAQVQKPEAQVKKPISIYAEAFLKNANLDWVCTHGVDAEDAALLNANVNTDTKGGKWASWFIPYQRVDGSPVPLLAWAVSAPYMGKGFISLRLLQRGQVLATLKIWGDFTGTLEGDESIVKALLARGDIRDLTKEDIAAML